MEIINKKENKLVFSAEIGPVLANAIRKYVYQIPIVAVDNVEISKNDSPLYDEMLAHRIGLIPIKTKKQGGVLKLKSKKRGVVYSEEIGGDAEVIYKKIPITLLEEGQELELRAKLRSGKGTEHTRFSPGVMFFRNETEIILDKSLKDKIKKNFPNLEIADVGEKISIKDNKEKEISDVCEGIAIKARKDFEIKEGKKVIINLESFGQLKTEEIFKKSIEELKKDLEKVSKEMK